MDSNNKLVLNLEKLQLNEKLHHPIISTQINTNITKQIRTILNKYNNAKAIYFTNKETKTPEEKKIHITISNQRITVHIYLISTISTYEYDYANNVLFINSLKANIHQYKKFIPLLKYIIELAKKEKVNIHTK